MKKDGPQSSGEVRSSMAAIAEDHAAALTLKGRAASHKAYELGVLAHNITAGWGPIWMC